VKLQQLRYIWQVSRQGMSVTAAARILHTAQPGISKQILLLEEELGVSIFVRSGKHFTGLTPAGEKILEVAGEILLQVDNLKGIAKEFSADDSGSLSLATTHTQSRYVLPPIIKSFVERYPQINLHMHQGSPAQIIELAAKGVADFAIATEATALADELVMMPCYRWNRVLLLPKVHPLQEKKHITHADIAAYPLVTYVSGFTGRAQLDAGFSEHGLSPRVVVTAADADVIKTYVRLGIGIGIVACMAFDAEKDSDLQAVDISHLFDFSTTWIGVRRGAYLRGFMYDFLAGFAPHLTQEVVRQAMTCRTQAELEELFSELDIPLHQR
jgi:LysR family cys regulon transcriptional activator